MNVQEAEGGDLIITPEGETPINEAEIIDHLHSWGFYTVRPQDIGALTSAPIFTDDATLAGLGDLGDKPAPDAKVWWFPDYALRSMDDDLRNDGQLVLTRAKAVQAEQREAPSEARQA